MSFSNINTILNFLNFNFVVIPQECCTKRLNQRASFEPTFVLLKTNDELDVSWTNFKISTTNKLFHS